MAVDTGSWMSDQAKFMRIKVNLPLEKPLRRCGKVASPKGRVSTSNFGMRGCRFSALGV